MTSATSCKRLLAACLLTFAACGGAPPNDAAMPPTTLPPPVDSTPPPVPSGPALAIAAPAAFATVSGATVLSATASAAVARVDFTVDGAAVASASHAPFETTWNSAGVPNGQHVIGVEARDAAGAAIGSASVSVMVDNGIGHVFVILLENHNWADIKGSASAPYINGTLLALGAHAENYMNPAGLHPSLPNYIWLEAGSNLGIRDDGAPGVNRQATTSHLVTLLKSAGITWKSYQEGISGTTCPVTSSGKYAPKHNPMIYFDDVIGLGGDCVGHVRPYAELARDLEVATVPAYSFITPDLCNDMHDSGGQCASSDAIRNGDSWLAREVPKILSSAAFKRDGVLFITFDEGESGSDGPIGMMVLSRYAKAGYSNAIRYTHSSLLRTVQHIFKVTPLLGDAANATDLRDLFADWR